MRLLVSLTRNHHNNYHTLGDLNKRNVLFHSCGNEKSRYPGIGRVSVFVLVFLRDVREGSVPGPRLG